MFIVPQSPSVLRKYARCPQSVLVEWMLRGWGWGGRGSVQGPLFALKMAKAKIPVCVPATDVLTGPLLCVFCSLALGGGEAHVNLHVLIVLLCLRCVIELPGEEFKL